MTNAVFTDKYWSIVLSVICLFFKFEEHRWTDFELGLYLTIWEWLDYADTTDIVEVEVVTYTDVGSAKYDQLLAK